MAVVFEKPKSLLDNNALLSRLHSRNNSQTYLRGN